MKKFVKEFKEFAMRGSVMDLAIGIVIGGAFGKIVSSFVSDVLMPPIGVLLGGVDFTSLTITLKQAIIENDGVISKAVTLNYGSFIQVVIDFIIVAFAIFIVIKVMNAAKRKQEIEKREKKKAKASKEEQLLTEIRDLLKKKS